MLYNPLGSLFLGQLFQRHDGAEQFADISDREGGQDLCVELAQQCRVTRIVLSPLEFGLRHEPGSQDGEGEMMFPSAVLLRPHLVPTQFRFAVLVGALNEVALALPPSQLLQGHVGRRVTQGIAVLALGLLAHHQPVFHRFTLMHRPHPAGGKAFAQLASLGLLTGIRRPVSLSRRLSARTASPDNTWMCEGLRPCLPLRSGMPNSGFSRYTWVSTGTSAIYI